MPNPFFNSFQQPQNPDKDILSNFNNFRANPNQFLADEGINVPKEYANNPEQTAKYLLGNMPQMQQNKVFQLVNVLKGMLGNR